MGGNKRVCGTLLTVFLQLYAELIVPVFLNVKFWNI
jgi:hypothetical protein